MNRARMAASTSKLLRFLPTAGRRRALLHLSTEKPSAPLPLHLDDCDDSTSPVSQIVEILKNQGDGEWKSDTHLHQILSTSPSLSVRHFLRIGRQLPSADAALEFVRHLNSEQYQLEPGSLSAVFQAAFEIAGRKRGSSDMLWCLVERSKEMGVPLSVNSATFLLSRFRGSIDRSMAVYDAVEPSFRNVHVRNLLLDSLFRCESLQNALKVLDDMLEPNSEFCANDATVVVVSKWIWRNITRENVSAKEEIVNLLTRLGDCGLFIDSMRVSQFIAALSRKGDYDTAWDLLHCYLKLGGSVDVACCNSLFSVLARKGKFSRMNLLLKEMQEFGVAPDVTTFGIFIKQLCMSGRVDECLELLKKIKEEGADRVPLKLDTVIYNMIIDGLCKLERHEEASALMEKMKLEGHCIPNASTYNCLMGGFFKVGEVKKSLELFNVMKNEGVKPNVITLNTLVDGLCKNEKIHSALKLFNEMKGRGLDGNNKTYTSLICAFCNAGNINKAMQLFDELKEKCRPDAVVYYTLILGFSRLGRMDDASSIMSLMKEAGFQADVGCYNTMIGGFCRRKKIDKAYELLKEMELDGIKPDTVTYNTLISFYSKTGDFETAHAILKRMTEEKIMPSVTTYGTMIHAYCLAGDLDEAMNIFNLMSSGGWVLPNNVVYNTLIDMLCKNEKVEAALSLFDDMMIKGLKPSANTFNSIFRGLKEISWLDKAFELMGMMVCKGCHPDYVTIGILTEWLSDVGETDRLRKFLEGFQD